MRAAAPALLLALMLTACAPGAGELPSGDPPSADGPTEETDAANAPLLADPDRDRNAPALANLPADLPPVDDDPDQFLGLDALAVARRLGAPDLVRRDGSAEVWLYDGGGCVVDVFLYADADADTGDGAGEDASKDAGLVARYVDLRGAAKTAAERRTCLADMLRTHQARAAGA